MKSASLYPIKIKTFIRPTVGNFNCLLGPMAPDNGSIITLCFLSHEK